MAQYISIQSMPAFAPPATWRYQQQNLPQWNQQVLENANPRWHCQIKRNHYVQLVAAVVVVVAEEPAETVRLLPRVHHYFCRSWIRRTLPMVAVVPGVPSCSGTATTERHEEHPNM
eukprot:TRINITY_DN4553_c0_g3_i1.p2 TRINITY_DN4553_c0_g3~~TRINITY_DN4553_c0_g3_i1.p2  ORF type:complete len:116 (-),score=19.64 TRINITY_DN4553_c0_g3_i1:532-879(-)